MANRLMGQQFKNSSTSLNKQEIYLFNSPTKKKNLIIKLFILLFGLISFPFTLIIKATKYIFTKYDLKNKLKIEQIKSNIKKFMLKYLKSTNSVYKFDEEIF